MPPRSAERPTHLNIRWLGDKGFEGSIRFSEIPLSEVPTDHGVYAVAQETTTVPVFVVPGSGRPRRDYPLENFKRFGCQQQFSLPP